MTSSRHHDRRQGHIRVLAAVLVSVLLASCMDESETRIDTGPTGVTAFAWGLPSGIPLPLEPAENPMSEAKFQLGRHLFYDRRLSGNGSQSCSSCHRQSLAFTDGRALPTGSTGQVLARNAQSLVNNAYNATLTWANPSLTQLEQQITIPLFSEDPVEHGITDANRDTIMQSLRDEPVYGSLFGEAFPEDRDPFTYTNVVRALASFVRGLNSFDSAFDRFQRGDSTAISDAARRGQQLFDGERLECFHCHAGYNFSDSTIDRTTFFIERPFHNTGLFNIGGTGAFPENNTGLFDITGIATDMGKFRAPTLRNIAVTAPYMHDGSMATLEEVIRFYAAGGRNITSGPHAGDGRLSPFKDSLTAGFTISDDEISDVRAFLESLTDSGFLTHPRFSNPWTPSP
ncbi:MAG: di-heme enzyme [Moraxellaceae bacterium]|nr:di-heme enzyme [Moraxellaceae bacterium]